jgi:hypothetical protein
VESILEDTQKLFESVNFRTTIVQIIF